jgi:hypothetical protein
MNGCANGQEGVAGFVTALKDIDGITRVGLQSSSLAGEEGEEGGSEGGCSGESSASFSITAVFDAAPVPTAAPTEAAVPPPSEESATTSEEG